MIYFTSDQHFYHTKIYSSISKKRCKIIRGPYHKIYEYFPLFTFQRFKTVEVGTFRILLKKIALEKIFYMHCTIKSNLYLFLRSERVYWRTICDYKKYPTLESYIMDIIEEKYGTCDFNEACDIFMKTIEDNDIYMLYNPSEYLPYPKSIREYMKNEKNKN